MANLLGDIKIGKELGYKGTPYNKYIWVACLDCGKARWVRLIQNKPTNLRCRHCAWKIIGTKQTINQYGKSNPNWKGGEYKTSRGYITVRTPTHPRAGKNGYVMRSRLVLEQKLGRYLLDGYEPHHINEIKDDDRPENLIELSCSIHRTLTNKAHPARAEHMRKFRHQQLPLQVSCNQ